MGVPSWFLGIVALWSLAILAFERYFVICRPLKNVRLGGKHAAMGLVFVWTFSFIWTIPPVLGWNSYTVSKIGTTCEPNWWAQNTISLNLPSFLHALTLYPILFISRSQSFNLCVSLSWTCINRTTPTVMWCCWWILTCLAHVALSGIIWRQTRSSSQGFFLSVILWQKKKKPLINPRLMPCSHQLKNCLQETGTKHLWLWLSLGLGTQTVQKHLNRECKVTQRRPRMGNIFTTVMHSCIHVDVQ